MKLIEAKVFIRHSKGVLVTSKFVFWPSLAGIIFLAAGVFNARKDLGRAVGFYKLIALSCTLVAASLAVFGAEHLVDPPDLLPIVPAWIPLRLFWVYFVGIGLIAAAASLSFRRYVRFSATLLAVMFFLFVLMIHIPNVASHFRDRIFWAIALRDLTFAGGALALAGSQNRGWLLSRSGIFVNIARVCIGLPLLVFAIEHFLHPEFAPGVPLNKLTPGWVPLPMLWAYLSGIVLLAGGVGILLNKHARAAAAWVGTLMTLLTLFLYFPILTMARGTSQTVVGINYVADTLLYGGAVLLLAQALRTNDPEKLERDVT